LAIERVQRIEDSFVARIDPEHRRDRRMPTVVTFPRLVHEPAGPVEANLVYGLAQEQSSAPWRFVARRRRERDSWNARAAVPCGQAASRDGIFSIHSEDTSPFPILPHRRNLLRSIS
jgi:hypothetical protein